MQASSHSALRLKWLQFCLLCRLPSTSSSSAAAPLKLRNISGPSVVVAHGREDSVDNAGGRVRGIGRALIVVSSCSVTAAAGSVTGKLVAALEDCLLECCCCSLALMARKSSIICCGVLVDCRSYCNAGGLSVAFPKVCFGFYPGLPWE